MQDVAYDENVTLFCETSKTWPCPLIPAHLRHLLIENFTLLTMQVWRKQLKDFATLITGLR